MHMLGERSFSSAELAILQKSGNAADGKAQTSKEVQVYVHDLELFVTVQILDETPAVLSRGQKPHLTKNGKSVLCNTENVVLLVVPALSSSSPGEAQYLYSLPERQRLRNLQENQEYKGSLPESHCRCSTSGSQIR